MLINIHCAKCIGIEAVPVTVEVDITPGLGIHLVGLADAAVKESLLRTITAMQAMGFRIPGKKIVINLAPADMHKKGSGYDVPIALGIIRASGQRSLPLLENYIIMGELGLDGSVREIPGALPVALLASSQGLKGCILPFASAAEAAEAQSELEQLRQSLLERQRRDAIEQIRIAITVLEPMNDVGRCLFTKEPEPVRRDTTYRYQHDVMDMVRALDEIAERNQRRLPPTTVNFKGIVGKEPYPVSRKAKDVIRTLVLRGIERLKNLFKGNKTRSEVVATFLAILDLCKNNAVTLEDDNSGENPNVKLIKEPNEAVKEMS